MRKMIKKRRRREKKKKGVREELSRDNGAEETGQVCTGLRKNPGQQQGQAEARARPPVLKAGRLAPSRGPMVADYEFLIGDGDLRLGDGEHVHAKNISGDRPSLRGQGLGAVPGQQTTFST